MGVTFCLGCSIIDPAVCVRMVKAMGDDPKPSHLSPVLETQETPGPVLQIASDLSSSGCPSHLGNEPVNGKSFSLSLSSLQKSPFLIQIDISFKKLKKQNQPKRRILALLQSGEAWIQPCSLPRQSQSSPSSSLHLLFT